MTISKEVSDFRQLIEDKRAKLAGVDASIDRLKYDRMTVLAASPHTSDIALIFQRGLRTAASAFERQLADRLSDTYTGKAGAERVNQKAAHDLLALPSVKLDTEAQQTRAMRGLPISDLNVAALAYFLRDRIDAEIPALIDRLCPEARNGMRQADRDKALSDIDAQIATLSAESAALTADLGAARAAFR